MTPRPRPGRPAIALAVGTVGLAGCLLACRDTGPTSVSPSVLRYQVDVIMCQDLPSARSVVVSEHLGAPPLPGPGPAVGALATDLEPIYRDHVQSLRDLDAGAGNRAALAAIADAGDDLADVMLRAANDPAVAAAMAEVEPGVLFRSAELSRLLEQFGLSAC